MSGKAASPFDAHIDLLADRVYEALDGQETLTQQDVAEEIERLAKAGFDKHHDGLPLSTLVENRVVEKYPEPSIHRRAELHSLVMTIAEAWKNAADFTQQRHP